MHLHQHQGRSVTIIKDAVPDDAQNFNLHHTGTGLTADFNLDDDADAGLPQHMTFTVTGAQLGTKTVTEPAVTGWTLTNLVCTGDDDVVSGATGGFVQGDTFVTLDVEAGETIECTYTNTKDASVKIIKDAVPDDAQNFNFDGTGTGLTADFNLDDDADARPRESALHRFTPVPARHQDGHRAPPSPAGP